MEPSGASPQILRIQLCLHVCRKCSVMNIFTSENVFSQNLKKIDSNLWHSDQNEKNEKTTDADVLKNNLCSLRCSITALVCSLTAVWMLWNKYHIRFECNHKLDIRTNTHCPMVMVTQKHKQMNKNTKESNIHHIHFCFEFCSCCMLFVIRAGAHENRQ